MPQQKQKSEVPSQPRAHARININLEKRLATYAAAAAATGVGLLAASQPSEAKIVYTPANVALTIDTSVAIDFNHDGINDVTVGYFYNPYGLNLNVYPAAGNSIRPTVAYLGSAAPLFFGLPIGGGQVFKGYDNFRMAYFGFKHSTGGIGAWYNIGTRYLGVKFKIGTSIHFGWVRVVVVGIQARITGYAYETSTRISIKAGAVSGPAEIGDLEPAELLAPASQPVSLGLLARGAGTMAIWRREEEGLSK